MTSIWFLNESLMKTFPFFSTLSARPQNYDPKLRLVPTTKPGIKEVTEKAEFLQLRTSRKMEFFEKINSGGRTLAARKEAGFHGKVVFRARQSAIKHTVLRGARRVGLQFKFKSTVLVLLALMLNLFQS